MSFPPADVVAAETEFYYMARLASEVTERLEGSGLSAETRSLSGIRTGVVVDLQGPGAFVLDFHRRGAYLLAGPRRAPWDGRVLAWPHDVDRTELALIFSEAVKSFIEGRPLPSPLRWGRTKCSPITDLADELLLLGVPADALELPALVKLDSDGVPRRAHGFIEWLRLTDPPGYEVRLASFHDGMGWAVDYDVEEAAPGAAGRLDLKSALGIDGGGMPLVPAEQLAAADLAHLLAEESGWVEGKASQWRRFAPTPEEREIRDLADVAATTSEWLRTFGFLSARVDKTARKPTVVDDTLFVIILDGSAGLPKVQQMQGIASVERKRLAVIVRGGYTSPAEEWADKAAILLFQIDHRGALWGRSAAAKAVLPLVKQEPVPPCRDGDDPTCRVAGCVIDDGFRRSS